jgi:hypothetical protein
VAITVLRPRRIGAIVRSSPLVLPVALSVLVIPLFTADLWDVVNGLHVRNLMLVAGLTVLPLLFSVRRRLSQEVGPALRTRGGDRCRSRPDGVGGASDEALGRVPAAGAETEIHP